MEKDEYLDTQNLKIREIWFPLIWDTGEITHGRHTLIGDYWECALQPEESHYRFKCSCGAAWGTHRWAKDYPCPDEFHEVLSSYIRDRKTTLNISPGAFSQLKKVKIAEAHSDGS